MNGAWIAISSQIGLLLMETEILETQWNSVQFDILVTSFTFTYIQIMMEGSFQGRCMAENL